MIFRHTLSCGTSKNDRLRPRHDSTPRARDHKRSVRERDAVQLTHVRAILSAVLTNVKPLARFQRHETEVYSARQRNAAQIPTPYVVLVG